MSMPPRDESARDNSLNSETFRLTSYVVNSTKQWISQGKPIESKDIQTYTLIANAMKNLISKG
jgi:hypothetical protein